MSSEFRFDIYDFLIYTGDRDIIEVFNPGRVIMGEKKLDTQAEREPESIIVGVIIGAVAGFIGGIARSNLDPYGELSIGLRDVHILFCAFYLVFAGMVSALSN